MLGVGKLPPAQRPGRRPGKTKAVSKSHSGNTSGSSGALPELRADGGHLTWTATQALKKRKAKPPGASAISSRRSRGAAFVLPSAVARPLPMGKRMTRRANKRSAIRKKLSAEIDWTDESSMRTQMANMKKAQRQAKACADWLRRKNYAARKEEALLDAMSAKFASREVSDESATPRGHDAYTRWLERKSVEEEEAREKREKNHATNGIELQEIRHAIEQQCKDDRVFELMDKFMVSLCRRKMVDPKDGKAAVLEAITTIKIHMMARKLKKQAAGQENGQTKEEATAQRIRMRLGEQVLNVLTTGRKVFGQIMHTVVEIFSVIDTDGDLLLNKGEFFEFCKRVDLGLGEAQLHEFWTSFDADGSGDISIEEFESLLVTVQAQRQIDHGGRSKRLSEPVLCAINIVEYMGDDDAKSAVDSVFELALSKRLRMAAESGADLSLWEFRQLVRQAPTKGLTANQRSNLYATLDVLFKKMKNGDERIRLGDIHFFLRNVSTKMHALQESKKDENLSDGPSPSDVADKVMLRVGRSFFRHVKQQNPDNNSMHENFTKMFQRFDSQGEGHLSRQELGKALKTMGVALSANQELMLFEAIDTDRSGTIEINEFLNFLNFVEKKIAERKKEKEEEADPRNNALLVNNLLESVGNLSSVMILLCNHLREVFTPA